MTLRLRLLGLLFVVASLGLLYPGVTLPVLTLSGELEKAELAEFGIDLVVEASDNGQTRDILEMLSRFMGLDELEGRVEAYRSSRSVLGMAEELADSGNTTVALLIVTFSVVIPVLKILIQGLAFALAGAIGRFLLDINAALGKWSMADVFVVAMLVAFMAGRAAEQGSDLLIMQAQLEEGFWYFLAYCLFSIAAGAVLQAMARRTPQGGASQAPLARETL